MCDGKDASDKSDMFSLGNPVPFYYSDWRISLVHSDPLANPFYRSQRPPVHIPPALVLPLLAVTAQPVPMVLSLALW